MGDPAGAFTKELDLTLDAAHIFGNPRSKRYALVVEDGKVKSVHVEAEPGTVDGMQASPLAPCAPRIADTSSVSSAENVLAAL